MDDQRTDRSGREAGAIFRIFFGAFGGMFAGYFIVAFVTAVFHWVFVEDSDANLPILPALMLGCPLGFVLGIAFVTRKRREK